MQGRCYRTQDLADRLWDVVRQIVHRVLDGVACIAAEVSPHNKLQTGAGATLRDCRAAVMENL